MKSALLTWSLKIGLFSFAVLIWLLGLALVLAPPEMATWVEEYRPVIVGAGILASILGLVAVFLVYGGLSGFRQRPTYRVEFKDKQMWNQVGSTGRGYTPLSDKIAAAGARPGDNVQIDEDGHVRVIGHKPAVVVDNTK